MRLFKWRRESKKIVFHNKRRNTINYVIENLEENDKNIQKEYQKNFFERNIKENLGNNYSSDDFMLKKEQIEMGKVDNDNFLCLKEYMVNLNNEKNYNEYMNLLPNNSGRHNYLSSNNSEDYKFYSLDYNIEENKDFSNMESEYAISHDFSKLMLKNSKFKNIIVDFPSKFKPGGESNSKSTLSKRSEKLSKSFSLNNVDIPKINNEENDQELELLFQKIKKFMREKYGEYKRLLEEVSLWEENGYKNGIKFYKKKENNNDSYTVIRGIIDTDISKENESIYESLRKKITNIKNNYHLNDIISSKELINYIWETDPLSYDNTVDRSKRVYTWDDGNPGFCIYYHSYKGAFGVQGRDFMLIGYKDVINNKDQFSSCEISNLAPLSSSSSPSRANSPSSNSLHNKRTIINNISPSRLKIWSKKNKKNCNSNIKTHLLQGIKSNLNDSAFFISSDLSKELSDDKKFHSLIQNMYNPSFVKAKCYLNGVKVEKLPINNNIILRMDILWIGDLNGKLPEFLKRTVLSSSLSTIKVLKDKYIEKKKNELLSMITN
ncbi:hypothetical protein CmeUKMEL1_06425 [Cryptosporidium meleagridis]|uniref:START domain protein n=1 Tax=Cryptosporidium meleagridis TaxID=93969 RepID=A0A2P4YZJ8_9CRYT|nr:hypothetical protein CmeUKMEL1_06425 [Cryptosporidium meleagridis]